MIVGKRHQIHTQISQIGHGLRSGAEGKLLLRRRRPSVRIGKFIVEHHDVRASHLLDQVRRDACRDLPAVLLQLTHHRIARIE